MSLNTEDRARLRQALAKLLVDANALVLAEEESQRIAREYVASRNLPSAPVDAYKAAAELRQARTNVWEETTDHEAMLGWLPDAISALDRLDALEAAQTATVQAVRASGIACIQGGYGCGCEGCRAMDYLLTHPDVTALLAQPRREAEGTPMRDGWQLMASVTKDRPVLLLEPSEPGGWLTDGHVCGGAWVPDTHYKAGGYWTDGHTIIEPTHWMPWPAPPRREARPQWKGAQA